MIFAVSPDGKTVLSGVLWTEVALWDIEEQREVGVLFGHETFEAGRNIHSAAFSPG